MTFPKSSDIPPPSPSARVWSPPDIGTYNLVQLGKHQGHWVHWRRSGSEPCLGEECPKARHKRGADWRAYTPCALWIPAMGTAVNAGWQAVVIGLGTENFKILSETRVEFPGPAFKITKKDKSNNYTLEVFPGTKIKGELPDCPAVSVTLHRLWRIRYDPVDGEVVDVGELGE